MAADTAGEESLKQVRPARTYTIPQGVPSAGLYQTSFSLSEANFQRLTMGSPPLLSVGAALMGLGLTTGLPILVDYLITESVAGGLSWPQRASAIAAGVFFFIGLSFLAVGSFASFDRWKVVRKIKRHFRENPEMPVDEN